MNANLMFWFYAYALTTTAMALALVAVSKIRKGEIQAHQKLMNTAITLILFFVLSYLVKMLALGREDKSAWHGFYLITLYIHESFIFLMLFFGGWARYLAAKFKPSLTQDQPSPLDLRRRAKHRKIGTLCLSVTGCALVTAAVLLYGMVQRGG